MENRHHITEKTDEEQRLGRRPELSDGYDGGKTEDGGDSRLQTIHMQMRDRT